MSIQMAQISEGVDGTQWGIDHNGRVHKKEGGSWKQNPTGLATHLAVLDANNVYVSNEKGEVYKLRGMAYNSEWEKDKDARNVISLRKSPDGPTIEVTNEQGDLYQLENGKWRLLFSERHPPNKTYTVKENETLGNIVRKVYGLSGTAVWQKADEIARLNGWPNRDKTIYPGDVIILEA
jgi:hypothetical protein